MCNLCSRFTEIQWCCEGDLAVNEENRVEDSGGEILWIKRKPLENPNLHVMVADEGKL